MKSVQLKTFVAVASEGSFSRAARRVHVSQSTASLHVRELEDEVGARLLERSTDGVRPTAAGQIMLSYAERLLWLEQEALGRVRAHAETPLEPLRVAASTTPAEVHLPPILRRWLESCTGLEVSVRVTSSAAATMALRLGDCDVALVGARGNDATLEWREYGRDEVALIGRSDAPAPAPGFPLVVRELGSGTRAAGAGLVPDHHRPLATVGSAEALRRCVLHGAGHAFLSTSAVAEDLASGRLRVFPWPGTPVCRSFYLVHRAGQHGAAVGALLGLLGGACEGST